MPAAKKSSAKPSAKKTSAKSTAKKTSAKKNTKSTARSKQTKSAPHSGIRLTDHEEIRAWAEERDAKPSCVKSTGGKDDVGMIRLDFPGYSGENSLEEISWDDGFDKVKASGLALIVQETTAEGQQSNFNKLVTRTAEEERP